MTYGNTSMIRDEKHYLEFIERRGVGRYDRTASSPRSYLSYLRSVSHLISRSITPKLLRTERDVVRIAQQLKGKRSQATIQNYCSAMRQYVAMVHENGVLSTRMTGRLSNQSWRVGDRCGRVWAIQRKPHHQDRMAHFLAQGIVAIGWPRDRFQNLSRVALRRLLEEYDRTDGKAVITKKVAAIWAFVHEMKQGDLLLVPEKSHVYVGTVASDYYYDASRSSEEEAYSNQRHVDWLRRMPFPKKMLPVAVQRKLRARFPPVVKLPITPSRLRHCLSTSHSGMDLALQRLEKTLRVRPIGYKDESSYFLSRKKKHSQVQRIHNRLVNAFNTCIGKSLSVDESDYDILVRDWQPGRVLLIEAKSSARGGAGRHQIREAIGQLFDYQFMLEQDGVRRIDLALLITDEPDEELKQLVHKRLGIEMIWRRKDRFHGTRGVQSWLVRYQRP